MEKSIEFKEIAKRLEQLTQWQEEQKKILFERQDNQRKVLGREHKVMYDMLGIFQADTDSECESTVSSSLVEDNAEDVGHPDEEKENLPRVTKKRSFLRRKQGLINRFKVDPDNFRLDNIPPYKFKSKHPSVQPEKGRKKKAFKKKSASKSKLPVEDVEKPSSTSTKEEKPTTSDTAIDLLEQNFQKSLMLSKTACNSTPDAKLQSSVSSKDTPEPISWATILDPQNLEPIENKLFCATSLESQNRTDDTSIFELLEQKAKDGSFNLNSSLMQKFLHTNIPAAEDSLQISFQQPLRPTPAEISQTETLKDSETSEEEKNPEPKEPKKKYKNQVRFVDLSSAIASPEELSKTLDSSDTSQAFEDFKKRIFESQSGLGSADASHSDAFVEDVLQKALMVKTRLGELESEIATFKQSNSELIKAKREHELERAYFEREQQQSREKLDDEKIQMELFLHDERMKLEDERKEWDKKLRLQKSALNAKEKRESDTLREQLEALKSELKKKEETHLAAQSRLRLRIKSLEGSNRQLTVNIAELQKENKRLDLQAQHLTRLNNDKMLREINRNISRLATKMPLVLPSKDPPSLPVAPSASPPPKKAAKSKQKTTKKRSKLSLKSNSKPSIRSPTPSSQEEEMSSSSSFGEIEFEKPKEVTFSKSPDRVGGPEEDEKGTERTATSDSFKREIVNADGSKDILYSNGNLKKIAPDGMTIRMLYFNRDIKETNINEGTVKYYYAQTNTWHTTYLDGLEILEFPNGQTEHRYKNGKIEVHFPNNTIKLTDPSDEHKLEEWRFPDGTNLVQMKNGDKILLLSNGQKEIHTSHSKRREYPDGTVKLLYPDGSQETRYSNGRIRLKDKDGQLIMDTN